MNVLIQIDALLMALGLLAMSPRLCSAFQRRRTARRSALDRVWQTTMSLLFYLGLCTLAAAGVDIGIYQWKQAQYHTREVGNARVGSMAPDFRLPALNEDRTIRLRDFRGHKPVVLIFGNFY